MEDIATLDEPLPLVIGDSWEWFVVLWADPDRRAGYDLTGQVVEAEIRWPGGMQPVAVAVTDAAAGRVTLSLTPDETMTLPRGRLSVLFLDIEEGGERATWFRAPVLGKEGSVVWLQSA